MPTRTGLRFSFFACNVVVLGRIYVALLLPSYTDGHDAEFSAGGKSGTDHEVRVYPTRVYKNVERQQGDR